MAPRLPTSEVDACPFENQLEDQFENQLEDQLTTPLHNPVMINEFLELHRRRELVGENCRELQDFLKQVSEFERKYEIPFSLLVKVKQTVTCPSNSFSVKDPVPGLNPFIFMDLVDLMKQAEIIRDAQFQQVDSRGNGDENEDSRGNGDENETVSVISPPRPPTLDHISIVVNIPVVVTHVQVSATLSRQQILPLPITESSEALLQPGNETKNKINRRRRRRRRRAPTSMKLGNTFFPLTAQAGLSVLTSGFDAGGISSTAEAQKVLNIATISNMVGYIGCLADIFLRYRNKCKAANVMGSIGSTAALFGFLTMMGTVLVLKPAVIIGLAGIVTVVFFLSVIKQ